MKTKTIITVQLAILLGAAAFGDNDILVFYA